VLTVCATLALLILGSLVTTLRAGMADKHWPTHPLHLFRNDLTKEAHEQGYAPFLYIGEHTHRLAGYLVGCCSIVLCVWLWRSERRRWVQWLGTVALLGVILQGVLGGMRVKLNAWLGTDLATLHGCTAQLVFALMASIALFTSSWWTRANFTLTNRPGVVRLTLWLAVFAYVQVVFGAVVRHTHDRLYQRLHFLVAFAVFALAIHVAQSLRREDYRLRALGRILAVLLTLQVIVGVEAWMMRFGSMTLPDLMPLTVGSTVVRTLHFIFGSLIFTTTVLLALLARHSMNASDDILVSPRRDRVMEGVA
jgi:cytochrome c oxidase assembly protein subunit 15